jgi:alpha-ketoglutarate-dependent taurine dioxygenase
MAASSIRFTRCQPLIGAEVTGVDLTKPIDAETADAIRMASAEYQVLVFRDQDISREQHKALASLWAVPVETPFLIQKAQANPIPEHPEIFNLMADGVKKAAADVWHTDESFQPHPPTVSILRAKVVPSLGGDTIFSSGVAAYARLPDDVKAKIRGLKALHGPEFQTPENGSLGDPDRVRQRILENPAVAQPVVRLHPVNNRPVLFMNYNYTGPIVGMEDREGLEFRRYLVEQFMKPDYQMRVKWRPHTIVVWDNASVQHYAVYDYNEPRYMERILVAGDKPAIGYGDVGGDAHAASA